MPKRYFPNSLPAFSEILSPPDSRQLKKILHDTFQKVKSWELSPTNCKGGIYVGLAGAAYAMWYAASKLDAADSKDDYLAAASEFAEYHAHYVSKQRSSRDSCAFLLGATGVWTVAALCCPARARPHVAAVAAQAATVLPIAFRSSGSDELFVGRAGYLAAVLNLRLKLGESAVPQDAVSKICAAIVESGKKYAAAHRSPSPLMYAYHGTEYLGAAHGLCAILQMLLSFPEELRAVAGGEAAVRGAVDWLLSTQQADGNFAAAADEVGVGRGDDELVHWCHGAPGVVHLLARAFLVWRDDKYLQACRRCADLVWQRGLLKKGPGVCHGVAGNGYVFLLLFRLTQEPQYLHRAYQFAAFLQSAEFANGARVPDCPLSLYEGLAGTLCFYADLLKPDQAEFPLFPVFF